MRYILLSGSNRGIGLAFARQLAARGDMLFATCRNPDQAQDLQDLAQKYPDQVFPLAMDVNDDESIATAFKSISVKTDKLDLLINNAGIGSGPEKLGTIERQHLLHFFNTNSVSPLLVSQAFLPLLNAGKNPWIINISSVLGSIGSPPPGVEWSSFAYRSSKAALNMITRTLATYLADQPTNVISFHPGWVKTDMGGEQAPLSPDESAATMLQTISNLRTDQCGCYLNLDGSALPW